MKQSSTTISADKSTQNDKSTASAQSKQKTFFAPVVNQPGDSYEKEADSVAEQVVSKPENEPHGFFSKSSATPIIQKAPASVQRDENDEPAPAADDTSSKVFTEGASLMYGQLKLQPGFAEWKEAKTKELKYKLWESQPDDFRWGITGFGLASAGLLGTVLATNEGFRTKTITALDGLPIPLFLLPYSEYLALSTFKYTLPTAENAPYKFNAEFDLDYFTTKAREKWGGPKVGLTFGVDTSYSSGEGFKATGGKINLTIGGGIVNLQGFINQPLPPTPILISNPANGENPVWLMRALPDQLEQNLPVGSGVFVTVDVLRVPELFGGKKTEKPKPKPDKDELSRKENSSSDSVSGQPAPSIVGDTLSSGKGKAMDGDTLNYMEKGLGYDFSQVRVHTDEQATESAKSINAKAYTSGNDIVFDRNQYQPSSDSGKKLLAHELTHVVQQSPSIQRKEAPSAEEIKDAEVTERIRQTLELGKYKEALDELNKHAGFKLADKKAWLLKHPDIRNQFIKRLPTNVIADTYSPEELLLRTSVSAFAIIDCWYHDTNSRKDELEKTTLFLNYPRLFDHILRYISPYTGEPLGDVISNLTKTVEGKKYPSSFGNQEFHVINLLAPTVEHKFKFYKLYEDLFKAVRKKFDPFTGIRLQTFENLTDTNEVNRNDALFIYNQLKVLDEEQRKAFIEVALFAGMLEKDKDAEAFYTKNYKAQYKVLPHNWDSAIMPWNWGSWDAPFAERLTVDHVELMGSALNYEDKTTRKFGFDRGIDVTVDKAKGKDISDATKLIEQMKDDANFLVAERLKLLLAIGVRGNLEPRITNEVLVPKSKATKIPATIISVIESAGFIESKGFVYQPDKAPAADHDKSLGWYVAKRTLFGGKESSLIGERRATVDLPTLQDTSSLKGSVQGLKFGTAPIEDDKYYNEKWLDDQIRDNSGSGTLKPNIDEFKGTSRRGKVFASINADIRQANIYASSLPIDGLNFFSAGTLYRSGPGLLLGVAVNVSWDKEADDPANQAKLRTGIENFVIRDFQLIGSDSTIAIGEIRITGLRLDINNYITEKGFFKGEKLVAAMLGLIPSVLKLIPYTVLAMTEEFKGAKVHKYKDALGTLMGSMFPMLKTTLSFTSVSVKNLYDTTAGFLDNFSIEEKGEDGKLVRQGLNVRETSFWTIDASTNIKKRIKSIDAKIRDIKAKLSGTTEKENEEITTLEADRLKYLDSAASKAIKYENRDEDMAKLRFIYRRVRELNDKLDEKFMAAKKKNPALNDLEIRVLEREKTELEDDLHYLDDKYFDDKKKAEGDDGGVARFEARKRKDAFEAKYRSYDVNLALKGITLEGGNYVKDLIIDSLKSKGFESPTLEGIEDIYIDSVTSAFRVTGKGPSAQPGKAGVSARNIHVPKITAKAIRYKSESFRIEADTPVLENVYASAKIDFAANPLDKDPAEPYKFKLTNLYIGYAKTDGFKLFLDKEMPLLDFPTGVPVEVWGMRFWDDGNYHLRIRDVKAQGKYQNKSEADKSSEEIGFGIDTKADNDTEAGRKAAIDLTFNPKENSLETNLNIGSAWIDRLNLASPGFNISSLPDTKAVELKNVTANVKVWTKGLDSKSDMTIDINSLHVGQIAAQGITLSMSEETEDPKKKKTVKKIQEVSLPAKDKVTIDDLDISGLRLILKKTETEPGKTKTDILLATTEGGDATVSLGKTDLGGLSYKEKAAKGGVLKAFALHRGKFDKLEFAALGRAGRTYTLKEFLKFFGRTRLEGIDATASFAADGVSGTVGVLGQKKKTPEGLKNVPISVDYHEATETEKEYYSIRLPLARINLPALHFKTGDHEITIPKSDKYSLSYFSDVDAKLRAYVDIPEDETKKVTYDIYVDSLDIGRMVVYGLIYKNSSLGVEVVVDRLDPLSIPNIKAGGFRISSAKGFDVFGKAGGFLTAGGDTIIEAGFEKIKATLENGEFLAETAGARSALDISVDSLGFTWDKDGNQVITLINPSGGFPKMKITQTDPVTKVPTVTEISSINNKGLTAEKVVIKLNADKTKEVEAEGVTAGGIKLVSTETKGTEVNTTTLNLDPKALNAKTATLKMNADGTKDISIKGFLGGGAKLDFVTWDKSKKTAEKNIALPDPKDIDIEEIKIRIDEKKQKTITLVNPTIKNFNLSFPSTEKIGDYLSLKCDLKVKGEVSLGDGNFDSMKLLPSLSPGEAVDAFVVNVPYFKPVEITNIRVEYKDTTVAAKKATETKETPLTPDQEKLLQLEKDVEDTRSTMMTTPSHIYSSVNDEMGTENPDWKIAYDKWTDAMKAYDELKSKMIKDAKEEAKKSSTRKYLDAVDGHIWASLVVYGTKLPLNIESYKGEKYVEISDDFVKGLKPIFKDVVRSTVSAKFWGSDEMKRIGKSLQRWYVWAVPATGGLIDAIAAGNGEGAAIVFLEKTTIGKGILDEDKNMFGLKFNFDTSWLLDISGADEFGVALCEKGYKHPEKDDYYSLYGIIEWWGYVNPATVTRTGQRDAKNIKDISSLTQSKLDDKGIKEAVAILIGYIKYGMTQEADNILKSIKKNISKVELTGDLKLTPQDVINDLLKEKKAGKLEFGKDKTIEGIHVEGTYTGGSKPEASGTLGGGPAGTSHISIPGLTYTTQDNNTKVSYETLKINPVSVNYKDDTIVLGSDSIQVSDLKLAFRKK